MHASRHNLNVSVLRLSNVFGCPVHRKINRWTLVPACFCLSAYEKNEIRLKSSGKQNRDFVSLEFISKCIESLIGNNKGGFNIYNFTSESLFSIFEVAKLVQSSAKSILNKNIELICESEMPLKSNQFLAKNNLFKPPTRDHVQDSLIGEINKILRMLIEV